MCYMQKDHSVAENIQMNIQLINFNILLGLSLTSICPTNDIKKINNNTNIHLDLRQIGCYCIRPTASYNNSHYYMLQEQMKVLRSLNNTSYLVTGLFD